MSDAAKCCSVCKTDRPLSAFRLRSRSGGRRHSECNGCRAAADRARRERRRIEALYGWASDVHLYRDAVPTVATLCAAIMARLGGADALARLLVDETEAAGKAHNHTAISRLITVAFDLAYIVERRPARIRRRRSTHQRRGE
jgi:hypothetical protein